MFDERLRSYAEKKLSERKNFELLHATVSEVRPDGVMLKDGSFVPCGLIVWSTGLAPREFTKSLPAEMKNKHGQVRVLSIGGSGPGPKTLTLPLWSRRSRSKGKGRPLYPYPTPAWPCQKLGGHFWLGRRFPYLCRGQMGWDWLGLGLTPTFIASTVGTLF